MQRQIQTTLGSFIIFRPVFLVSFFFFQLDEPLVRQQFLISLEGFLITIIILGSDSVLEGDLENTWEPTRPLDVLTSYGVSKVSPVSQPELYSTGIQQNKTACKSRFFSWPQFRQHRIKEQKPVLLVCLRQHLSPEALVLLRVVFKGQCT